MTMLDDVRLATRLLFKDRGVSQRARELGVRIALGARTRQVLWVATRSASALDPMATLRSE